MYKNVTSVFDALGKTLWEGCSEPETRTEGEGGSFLFTQGTPKSLPTTDKEVCIALVVAFAVVAA